MSWWTYPVGAIASLWVLSYVLPFLVRKKIDFSGKHVLITGGSTGLGLAIAELVVEGGGNVTIISSTQSKLDVAKQHLETKKKQSNQKILAVQADVTNDITITKAVERATQELGVVDFLIANAGLAKPGLVLDTPNLVYKQQMELNYLGAVYTIKAALPSIRDRNKGGHIIIVSSAMGLVSFAGYSQYAPTKWALRGLSDALRNELQPYNIKVSIYYPANMQTPGFDEENRMKPEVTRIIEDAGNSATPRQAATCLIDGIERGYYHITNEYVIELLRSTFNGCSPRNHFLLECLLSPLVPLFQWVYTGHIDRVARTCAAKEKKAQ